MYEYECTACGHRFERIQKFSDAPIEECPACGERKVQKLLSSPAIQFKGTGWYITDYAKKSGAGSDTKGSSSAESKESNKESKESKESKGNTSESKSSTPSPASSTPKASGE